MKKRQHIFSLFHLFFYSPGQFLLFVALTFFLHDEPASFPRVSGPAPVPELSEGWATPKIGCSMLQQSLQQSLQLSSFFKS